MGDDKDLVIRSLASALKEALLWWLVDGRQPPYRVPMAIQADLWKWTTAKDKAKAHEVIVKAVDRAAGQVPWREDDHAV
jgi:hypothetical protein